MTDTDRLDPAGPGGPAAPDDPREREALRGRISARLFGDAAEPVRIGRFRVLSTLGRGGMGVVYAAHDDELDRDVAVKILRDDQPAHERERVRSEARALARLSHPNVVQVYEVGEAPDGLFLVMELVRGASLDRWLAAAPRAADEILAVFAAAGRGLAAAHAVGVVHRDIKPANILVGDDGRTRIADFGLARARAPQAAPHLSTAPGSTAGTERSDHGVVGTPAYMAPEQHLGLADARSDQYSFCVALHEALLGRRPAEPAGTSGEAPLGLSRDLQRALSRGLSADPAQRFPNIDTLVAILSARPRRGWLLAAGGGSFAVLGALVGGPLLAPSLPVCGRDVAAFTGVWDDATRAMLTAPEADGDPTYALGARRHLAAALDHTVERWHAVLQATCVATQLHGARSTHALARSEACLSRVRRDLADTVAWALRASRDEVTAFHDIAATLPEPESCRDPDDRSARPCDEVDALLGEARRHYLAHNVALALAHGQEALHVAQEREDLAGEAGALLLVGELQLRELQASSEAERALELASRRASSAGQDDLLWQVHRELAFLHAYEREDLPAAQRSMDLARSALDRLGASDPLARASLDETESYLASLAGHLDRSAALRLGALAARRAALPPGHPDLERARIAVANAVADAERPEEALALYREIADERASTLGPDHPDTALAVLNVGLTHLQLGELDLAATHLTQSRAVFDAAQGPKSARVASIDRYLAQVALNRGDPREAEARALAAITVFDRVYPPHFSERVDAYVLLAEVYRQTDNHAGALRAAREVLEVHDAGGRVDDLPELLTIIGDNLCLLDRCGEALTTYARLDLHYQRHPPDPPSRRAYPVQGLGRAHTALGNHAVALPFLERALEMLLADPAAAPEMVPIVADQVADCLGRLKLHPRRVRRLRDLAATRRAALHDP